MKKRIYIVFLAVFISYPAWAVMPFYTGARAEGMGEAFTSISDESSGLFYNPAGLSDMEKKEVSALCWKDYFGTGYSNLSLGMPAGKWGGLAAGWSRTSNTFEKTDAWGNTAGNADISSDVFMLGAGYYKGLPLSLGFTAKFITEKIDTYSASGWALDAGALIDAKPLRIGVTLQNAVSGGLNGTSLAGGSVSEKIPSTLRVGLSMTNNKTCGMDFCPPGSADKAEKLKLEYTFAADLAVPTDDLGSYALSPGAELWFNDTIAVRAGYRELRDYTCGLSVKLSFFRLDYAFIISKELENSNIFSLSMFF